MDAFYLYRDPLAQFMSYNWPTNDYFAAATLVQLMHSRSLWPMVREFMTISWRERFRLKWQTPANKFESKLRKARRILSRQSQDAIYAMFLLSHQTSLQQAERNGLSIESTDQISLDASKRKSLEARFAISLAQIHPTPQKSVPDFDTSKHEARVSALLGITQRTQA